MSFVAAKALVLIQLSVLLFSCFTAFSDEVDLVSWAQSPHHHAPSYPPVEAPKHHWPHPPSHPHHHKGHPPGHPPMHSPTNPPSHPPVHPPMHPPIHPPYSHLPTRSLLAVQGVVYCKSCKYIGVDTLSGASPLPGAVVKLQCNNTKYPLVQEGKTDEHGFFFIMPPKKISTYGFHKCKASLVSSPSAYCNNPTNLNDGLKGAILKPLKPPVGRPLHPLPYEIFSVGPFAFEPSSKLGCPH
ncbi:hypothetical protein F0562_014032 [Nyssa sinensis]|uniref:Uncharacterized protein n=1 Tax=Nyssa sinensis TaxID=561372 RepID=A0A5J4ZPV5_9ASTE|nr:hypothetical protein F0562_014032 [Nyssa sinensis]